MGSPILQPCQAAARPAGLFLFSELRA